MNYLLLQEGSANTEDPDPKLELELLRRPARAPSDKTTASCNWQHIDDIVAAHGDKLVEHVHRDADMVWYDPHDIADTRRRLAGGQV